MTRIHRTAPESPRSIIALARFEILAAGLDHPECVAYGPDGNLYAGGEAGQIYRVSPAGQVEQIAGTGGFILGLALDAHANVYACDPGRGQLARIRPTGAVSTLSTGTPDAPMVNPNYLVFDAAGRLYVTDSGHWRQDDGLIFVVDAAGRTRVASHESRCFPNGLALSADGRWLYVVESTLPGVARLAVQSDGALGGREVVLRLPSCVPDGLAFDAAGNLYVACYRPDRIYRLSPHGVLELWAEDWAGTMLAAPTNLAFAGPELDLVVVANLGRWHLAVTKADIPGQLLLYPDFGTTDHRSDGELGEDAG